MSNMMVGDITGIYAEDNFEFAVVSMKAGTFCLFMGIVSLGLVYTKDLQALYTGKPSITTTDLRKLPQEKQKSKAQSNILFFLLCVGVVIIGLIEILVPYNQWIKMGISLLAITGLFIILRLCYIAYRKIWNKEKSN
jgi:hypothetical protein